MLYSAWYYLSVTQKMTRKHILVNNRSIPSIKPTAISGTIACVRNSTRVVP